MVTASTLSLTYCSISSGPHVLTAGAETFLSQRLPAPLLQLPSSTPHHCFVIQGRKMGKKSKSDKSGRGGRSTRKAKREVCQLPSERGLWWCPEDSSDFSLAITLGVCWLVQNQTKSRFRSWHCKGQLKTKLWGSIFSDLYALAAVKNWFFTERIWWTRHNQILSQHILQVVQQRISAS